VETSNQPAVGVDNLVVDYGTVHAVNDVSFSAYAGKVTTVLGPNGAGKTSTIEVCEGFRNASAGRIRVLGLDPRTQRNELNQRMGVMLQNGGVYPSARVAEVVRHYCTLYGKSVKPNLLLAKVGLSELRNRTWRRLSGGEQQRLSFALALAARPEVAFLDEPTSGIDVIGRELIRNIIRELAVDGCAVIVATHELDEAERIADKVIIFDKGKIVADGSLDELRHGRDEIRFRSPSVFDLRELSRHLDVVVQQIGPGEFLAVGTADAQRIAKLSQWMADAGADIRDLRAGQQRLEDVFRRLTMGEHQ
jgi:ABC-2 type transport system ATP-binding protein